MTRKYPYAECRALGHAWEQQEDDRSWIHFGVAMQFRCIRCTSVRRDVVSPATGELLYRSYSKPDDYKLGPEQVGSYYSRGDWRIVLLQNRKRRARKSAQPKLTIVKEA